MAHYKLFFDGSCGPKNPGGTAAYGFALMKDGQVEPVEHGSGVIGSGPGMTNNLAEFYALDKGLEAFGKHWNGEHDQLSVYGDSNLVIQIMSGHWRARVEKAYYSAFDQAMMRVKFFRRAGVRISFDWIPREHNTLCDDLSKAHQKKV